jgi:hypothetical protein
VENPIVGTDGMNKDELKNDLKSGLNDDLKNELEIENKEYKFVAPTSIADMQTQQHNVLDNAGYGAKSRCTMDDPSTVKRIKVFNPLESLEDKELLRVLKIMKKVHRRFFKTNDHVRKILRIKKMRNIRIAASSKFFLLIAFTCAKLDFINLLYVIENEEAASRLKALNLAGEWLVECAYQKCIVGFEHFIISDCRAIDEYQKDLEEEFFN